MTDPMNSYFFVYLLKAKIAATAKLNSNDELQKILTFYSADKNYSFA
jgi:hypothetical protein